MRYFEIKSFSSSLRKLRRDGGQSKNASEKTQALLFRIINGDQTPFSGLNTTNNGETRIKNAVKYDLSGFCRLVTVVYGNQTIFLFLGTHADVDKFLDKNAGATFTVNPDGEIGKTSTNPTNIPEDIDTNYLGKLFNRLEKKWRNQISGELPFVEMEDIVNLEAGVEDSEISNAVGAIRDKSLQNLFKDVLILLNRGDVEQAQNRIKLFTNEITELDALPTGDLVSVKSGEGFVEIEVGSQEYMKWLDHFLQAEHAFEWFLFMHSEQQALVDMDYSGSAKLSGVSGSGKTAVAIKRAIRLAEKYYDENVLLVTINKSLSQLISDVVTYACTNKTTRSRIHVKSFSEVAYALLNKFDPDADKKFKFESMVLEDHKDEVYREFYRCLLNNTDAKILLPTHRLITSQGIDAERYIYEEFDWVRSVFSKSDRENYLKIDRKGRAYPLTENHRQNILSGLEKWEDKMGNVGVIDPPGLTMAVMEHLQKIKPQYRSIIVDEAQDFGTTELQVLRALVAQNDNDFFFCGDGAQQVQAKQQNFSAAKIYFANRVSKLEKNYRNSKEILEIAHQILTENLSAEHFDLSELDISDPEFASRSSAKPVILKANSLELELAAAIQLMRDNEDVYRDNKSPHSGCIALAGYSLFEIEEFGDKIGIPVLNGERNLRQGLHSDGGNIFLSDLEQTKGYEFDTIVIINCEEGILPPDEMPKEEIYRFVSRFYVAMTRAKDQLVFSFSKNLSSWLQKPSLDLSVEDWFDYVDEDTCKNVGSPGKLPEFPGEEISDILQINGSQFVYTSMARGLESSLLEKIPQVIDGRGLLRNKKRVKWQTVSQAISDMRGEGGRGRHEIFGPKSDADILNNVSKELNRNTLVMSRTEKHQRTD